jgi:hypothetical protein
MATVLSIIGWLIVSLALIIPTNRLAQRLYPTKDSDDPTRRYLYGLIIKLIGICIFAAVGSVVVGGSILFGFARW